MKKEAKLFEFMAVGSAFFAILYIFCTAYFTHAIEIAGSLCLVFSALLCLILGSYFRFISRRIDIRPEDYPDAEISDGAGYYGFFSPFSIWPFCVAFSASIVAVAFALQVWWLIIAGVILLLVTVGGLVFEYHIGPETH